MALARRAASKMAPGKKNQEALKQALKMMARPLEAVSLAKMSQKPNTRAAEPAEEPVPKKAKFAPPASWLGNHEQNDDAEQNGEFGQNADAAPRIPFPANAAGTGNASPAETHQPAPAGAAESKPQEACNK